MTSSIFKTWWTRL
jgi:hypothetical protein